MKIEFAIDDIEFVHSQINANNQFITFKSLTDLDENGRPTNCFVIVEDAPTPVEDETADLIEAATILGLELEDE